ncbi:MAG TPA: flagellar hook-basal body complex protein, partial [Gemmataceae bacterium]|nr:flagellar hook-basal body complex protein [Gemmataceae bacterium]
IPIGTGIPGNATTNVVLQGNLTAGAVGPQAQLLTSAQPMQAGGVAATAATLLNSLDDNLSPYATGDKLDIQGLTAGNTPVNITLPVDATTTVGDVINAINTNFPGSTASLDASGNIVVTSNTTGTTGLNLSINDDAGNVSGGTSWGNHNLNLTTTGKDGDTVKTGIQIYDSQGTPHNLNLVFQKQANNVWNLTAAIDPSQGTILDNLVSNIAFNEDGSFRQVTGTGLGNSTISVQFNGFSSPQTISFNFGTTGGFNGLTQVGGSSSAVATGQDGFAAGYLTTLSVAQDGTINGVFTNGKTLPIAQMAVATFANPGALNRIGNNYYSLSSESGPALLGAGLSGGRGSVQQKALESSNVDVSLEFTRLIIAQRAFQVNARVITASDQILQDLANILR